MKTIFFSFFLVFLSYTLCAQDVYRLEKVQSNVSFDLLSISLSADDYGCISGRSDTLLITHDGGKSWKPKRLIYTDTTISTIESINVLDSLSSFALVVMKNIGGRILYSSNGWLTYEVLKTPTNVWGFITKGKDTLFCFGRSKPDDWYECAIWSSYDHGKSWTKLRTFNSIDNEAELWLNQEILITRSRIGVGETAYYSYTFYDIKKKEIPPINKSWEGHCRLTHVMNNRLMAYKNTIGITEPCEISPVFLPSGNKYILPPDTPSLRVSYTKPVHSPYGNNILIVEKEIAKNTYEHGYMETTNNGQSWNIKPIDNTSSAILDSLFYDPRSVTKTKHGIIIIGRDGTILQTASTTGIHENENIHDNSDIHLSPNPALNTINLNITINNGYVSNSFGEKVLFINEATNTLDISHLPIGYYFLTISTSSGSVTKAFVKQ